jgi:REP element-mobilizing transposase RayT
MTYNPAKHHRRSIRLKGYDYSRAGLYFITICTQNRVCLFGKIENGVMELNDAGQMIKNEWLKLPERFQNIELHEFIIMPNHFHAILEIVGATLIVAPNVNDAPNVNNAANGENGQPQGIALTESATGKTVGEMVGAFESITTVEYIRGVKNNNWQLFNKKMWQRNYREHIIRNEQLYVKISEYIINNPANWWNDS